MSKERRREKRIIFKLGLEGVGGCILKIAIAKGRGVQFLMKLFFFLGGGVKFSYTTLF